MSPTPQRPSAYRVFGNIRLFRAELPERESAVLGYADMRKLRGNLEGPQTMFAISLPSAACCLMLFTSCVRRLQHRRRRSHRAANSVTQRAQRAALAA